MTAVAVDRTTIAARLAPLITMSATLRPRLAGGQRGARGTETYPLRIDMFCTHELYSSVQQFTFESAESSHTFEFGEFGAGVDMDTTRDPRFRRRRELPFNTAALLNMSNDNRVANSAAVVVNVYATTFNRNGQECWTSIGTTILTARELQRVSAWHAQYHGPGAGARYPILLNRDPEFPSDRNSDNPFDTRSFTKGHLVIDLDQLYVAPFLADRLRPATELDLNTSVAALRESATTLSNAISRSLGVFFGRNGSGGVAAFEPLRRATKSFLAPYHVPEYRTSMKTLPASVYSFRMPEGPIDLDYYEGLLDVALERTGGGLTRQWIERHAAALPNTWQYATLAAVAVRLTTAYANSLCYTDDFVNTNVAGSQHYSDDLILDIEDFKIARLHGGDDCEGVALEPTMHARELLRASPETVDRMSYPLRIIRDVIDEYTHTMTLGCVTNELMKAGELNNECSIAHTFSAWLPRAAFSSASANGNNTNLRYARFAGHHPLIAEGTAPTDPAMRPVAEYYHSDKADRDMLKLALQNSGRRRAVMAVVYRELENAGAEYAQIEAFNAPDTKTKDEDYSTFYKWIVSLARPAPEAGQAVEWAYTQNGETYGVSANDFLDGNWQRVKLQPYFWLSVLERRYADAVLMEEQPIPVLRAAHSGYQSVGEKDGSAVSRWSAAFDALGATLLATGAHDNVDALDDEKRCPLHPSRTFITARLRDLDERLIKALRAIIQAKEVQSIAYKWYNLNRAVDNSANDNVIVDLYIVF